MNNAKAEQPPFLPPGYELLSQLKENENDVSVCVVRDRESFGKMLFKRAETADGTEQLKNEMRMLSLIHAQDNSSPYARLFPSVRDSGEEGGCWFVREWIEGHTLAELAESGRDEPGLPRMQALGCLISVTEQLFRSAGVQYGARVDLRGDRKRYP